MLVQERPADGTVGLEPSGQLQTTLGGDRCRESNHCLCGRLSIRCGWRWEIRRIESNSVRLANCRDQLSDTAAGSLLISCRSAGRLCPRGCAPDLSKVSLEHRPANWVAVGRKDTANSSDECEPDLRHLDWRVLTLQQFNVLALLELGQDRVAGRRSAQALRLIGIGRILQSCLQLLDLRPGRRGGP